MKKPVRPRMSLATNRALCGRYDRFGRRPRISQMTAYRRLLSRLGVDTTPICYETVARYSEKLKEAQKAIEGLRGQERTEALIAYKLEQDRLKSLRACLEQSKISAALASLSPQQKKEWNALANRILAALTRNRGL